MKNTHFNLARRLASLLTQWDAKQSGKRSYNRNALSLYLQAVHSWEEDPKSVADPVGRLSEYFTHNPNDKMDFCLAPVRAFARELLS